jgi:D-beta-D-heptose 7-phosphate kinase/D-beta-D-heptose 1-phosphate adenosyltransferase
MASADQVASGGLPVNEIITAFSSVRALVVGDVMLDRYVWGVADRISPEAPVPVLRVESLSAKPGGAANAAASIAALGGHVALAGAVGRDPEAELLIDGLVELGVDIDGLVLDQDRPTTTKTRFYAHGQQLLRTDVETTTPVGKLVRGEIAQWTCRSLPQTNLLVVSDYGKGVVSTELACEVISAARGAGHVVAVDPKGRDYRKYRGASVITPNVEELGKAVNAEPVSDHDVISAGYELFADLGHGTALVVTRGADGMTLIDERGSSHLAAEARAVYDVTGAGDTVLATLALALAAGADLRIAAAVANRAAAIAVTRVGAALVTGAELLATFVG